MHWQRFNGRAVVQQPLLVQLPVPVSHRRVASGQALDLTEIEREAESDQEHIDEHQAETFARWEARTGPKAPKGCESINYEMYGSDNYLEYLRSNGRLSKRRKIFRRGGSMRWIFLCFIGGGSGLVAVVVDYAMDQVFDLKMSANNWAYEHSFSIWQQYLAWVSVAVALVSIAGILVCYIDPFAAGSGIPEIKCYLNGIEHFPSVVGLKTLLAKAVGIVFSVSAGLPCGKEGPMIHSGAIIGAVVAGFRIDRNIKPYVYTQEVRDLVAAGASAGVSAAFGAPLGSVLFAIEEGSSHMNPQIMTRLFVACAVAALVSRSFSGWYHGLPLGLLGWRVPVSFGRFSNMDYHIQEFALFGLMAICGGLLGGLFNCLNKRLTLWRQRHIGGHGHKRFLEVLLVTFVVSSFDFLVVALCSDSPLTLEDLPPTMELYWNLGGKAMKNLFHGQENYHWGFLLLFAVKNFFFACWNYGTGVPSGLFVPSLLTGAAFGRLVGQLVAVLRDLDTNGNSPFSFVAQPGTYALIGACSMLAGTARITISLAMILMETSGEAEFGLPIFLSVMVAKWVGDRFNRGIYDLHIIELKHIPFLEQNPEKEMIPLQARDVMQRNVVTLELVESVSNLVEVLAGENHHSFPVLYPGTKRVAGMLSQSVLRRILEHGEEAGLFVAHGDPAPTKHISWQKMLPSMPFRCQTPAEVRELVADHVEKLVDLRPYVNRNSLFVLKYTSVWNCYRLFRQLGMRHLAVLGRDGSLVGIITRKDLILAAEAAEEDEETSDDDEDQFDEEARSPEINFAPSPGSDHEEDGISSLVRINTKSTTRSNTSGLSQRQLSERQLESTTGGMGGAGM